jgi:hypothetical protein
MVMTVARAIPAGFTTLGLVTHTATICQESALSHQSGSLAGTLGSSRR